MATCELIVIGNPVPLGKIHLDDENGFVQWRYIPVSEGGNMKSGKVRQTGNDSLLLNGSSTFGTLKNFSLYHYNPKVIYMLVRGKSSSRCKVEVDEFEMDF
jgi:hypothetical protein